MHSTHQRRLYTPPTLIEHGSIGARTLQSDIPTKLEANPELWEHPFAL